MDNIQHDPRTKQQIKDLLYAYLYTPIDNQFKNWLNSIISRNTIDIKGTHRSFIYRGVVYSSEETQPPRKMNRLLEKYHPLMDEYLVALRNLNNNELPQVLGFITQVLNSSNDLQDYLRVFPESMHRPIQDLINSCPCGAKHLSEETILQLQEKNKLSIKLIKERLVTNLLI